MRDATLRCCSACWAPPLWLFLSALAAVAAFFSLIPFALPLAFQVILLFQNIDGVDLCLYCLYMQEYGDNVPPPNKKTGGWRHCCGSQFRVLYSATPLPQSRPNSVLPCTVLSQIYCFMCTAL